MADSDIQFLGKWNAQQAASNGTFVSAIVLTPTDGTGSRTFSRSQTSLVHIGRIPTPDALDADSSIPSPDGNAGFTNPVMSRKHAKITFADSGSAFIIDTHSHHGTWVFRPALKQTTKLASESPYMLLDGDKVTFGKEVAKNGTIHQPLVVTVKLLHTYRNTMVPLSPVAVSSVSDGRVASPKSRNRFGLHVSSDSDSDVNEGVDDTPCTGPNAIHVDRLFNVSRSGRSKSKSSERVFALDSPSSLSSYSITSSSPSSIHNSPTTPQHTPSQNVSRPSDSLVASPAFSNVSSRYSPSPDLHPTGLELSGMESQPDNPAPVPEIQSVAPATPPWRRAGALLSGGNLFDAGVGSSEQPQRQIGRLLNPLWMRSMRVGGDDVLSQGGGAAPSRSVRLLSGVGLFSRLRGRAEESTKGHTHERHSRLHERHGPCGHHGGHEHGEPHGAGWGSHTRHQDMTEPMEEDEPVAKSSHEALSSRVDDIAKQLAAVQDTARNLENGSRQDEISPLKATLESLESAVAALRADMATIQADISTGRVDIGMLRVDLATHRTSHRTDVSAMKESAIAQGVDLKALRSDLGNLQAEVDAVTHSLETSASDVVRMRSLYDPIRGEVLGLQGDLGRVDAVVRKLAMDLQVWEETSVTKIREEIQAFKDRDAESPSLAGKRKRGHDEAFSSDSDASAAVLVAPSPRPFKRLRTVADFAAAGVVGAFGAYLGLAYLQL